MDMKNWFYWMIAFALCLNNVNAQTLKTYSGKFQGGQATYTYRDNPEGGRIFEGKFTYVGRNGTFRVTGSYKNDKKDGLWTYKDDTDLLKVHYKEGVRDGFFSYQGKSEKANLTFKDNKIIGKFNLAGEFSWGFQGSILLARGTLVGQCNEAGYADGTWILDTTPDAGVCIYRVTYKDGYLIKAAQEDISTGDITDQTMDISFNALRVANKDLLEIIDRGMTRFKFYEITRTGTPPDASESKTKVDKVMTTVDVMPQFPGGMSEVMKYIAKNLCYPKIAKENGIQGRVIVRFIVSASGKVENVKVLRSLDPYCDKEAIRLVKSMPNWIPGKEDGKAVSVYYTLPIVFRL